MASQLLFTVIIALMKVAILMTYLRKSSDTPPAKSITHDRPGIFPSKTNKWFCRIMIAYTVGFNFACFFITLFQCSSVHQETSSRLAHTNHRHRPASTYWEIFKYIGKAKCLNLRAVYYFHGGQNTLGDFVVFLWCGSTSTSQSAHAHITSGLQRIC